MSETIRFAIDEGIGRLAFDRPSRHNALGSHEIAQITSVLDGLSADTRVLVICNGGGPTFCGGADLAEIESGALSGDQFQAMTNRIAELSIPSIAVVNGNVFGGGFELAMSCDFRIGTPGTVVRVPAAALGLCYPVDGIRRLVARLGVTTAKRILVGAEEFTSEEMHELGVFNWLVSPTEVMDSAMDGARQMARLAPLAVRAMLEIIRQSETGDIDSVRAAALADLCANSEDLREGLAAKRERRVPVFRGC